MSRSGTTPVTWMSSLGLVFLFSVLFPLLSSHLEGGYRKALIMRRSKREEVQCRSSHHVPYLLQEEDPRGLQGYPGISFVVTFTLLWCGMSTDTRLEAEWGGEWKNRNAEMSALRRGCLACGSERETSTEPHVPALRRFPWHSHPINICLLSKK